MRKRRKSAYKPLSFGTTMRNPERVKGFLIVLYKHKDKILTNEIIMEVVFGLIKDRYYTPRYAERNSFLALKIKNNEGFSDQEIKDIIKHSPQEHQEAGFDKGWPSRFDTWYSLAKELGFVYYEIGKTIEFSEAGIKLVHSEDMQTDNFIFLNALVKYRRDNPFRRILNSNSPLLLLLQTIKKLNNDKTFNSNGISKAEIPILLCWRNGDAEALYKKIKEVRLKYKYTPSDEYILDICDELTDGRHNSNKPKTILQEYPDDFIRKMKLTGLISIRGMGRFIDINKNEISKIDYILKKYNNLVYPLEERAYFDFVSQIDDDLIEINPQVQEKEADFKGLKKWSSTYNWDLVKKELLRLSSSVSSSDKILRYIPRPLRLEFLTSLAIVNKYPKYRVKPNYIVDDEGLPSSHAPGNKPDIECIKSDNNFVVLVEVTLLNGTAQYKNECFSVIRHLDEYKAEKECKLAIFIAPQIFKDTERLFEFEYTKEKLYVKALNIKAFIAHCEDNNELS